MATFSNQATLSYNGMTTTSNTVTGEVLEVLSATKTSVVNTYSPNDSSVTYIINITNSGNTAYNGLTITDNLGEYTFNTTTLTPLSYVAGSVKYFVNGALQTTPTVTAGPPLTISGINVPQGGNATIIYEAQTNRYAPLDTNSTITNQATVSGENITTPIVTSSTITPTNASALTITKAVSPNVITENEQLTYTFTIQNSGNAAATEADLAAITDTFNPILSDISVKFNSTDWSLANNYTYNQATGEFATVAGQITVPAAEYTQDAQGRWVINPGVSVLTVTGRV